MTENNVTTNSILSLRDFATMTGISEQDISPASCELVRQAKLEYVAVSGEERDRIILDALKLIDSQQTKTAGDHRKEDPPRRHADVVDKHTHVFP